MNNREITNAFFNALGGAFTPYYISYDGVPPVSSGSPYCMAVFNDDGPVVVAKIKLPNLRVYSLLVNRNTKNGSIRTAIQTTDYLAGLIDLHEANLHDLSESAIADCIKRLQVLITEDCK